MTLFLKLILRNDTFHGFCKQSALFRVLQRHHVLSFVTVGYVLSSILLVVFLSFSNDD